MSAQIIQGLSVQNFTLACGISKATELARAMWRTSQLVYNMRSAMFRMFVPGEFEGIVYPN